jgi:peptide methionine sulfoxide reductase MsrB
MTMTKEEVLSQNARIHLSHVFKAPKKIQKVVIPTVESDLDIIPP